MMCSYIITAEHSDQVIQAQFISFKLQPMDNTTMMCTKDYIEIYDGATTDHPKISSKRNLLGRYCGDDMPHAVFSSGQSLLVVYKTMNGILPTESLSLYWLFVKKPQGINLINFSVNLNL